MKARYDIQMMVQVSKMYYEGGLTQNMIATELGISRSSISMILSEARDYGIVEITIKDPKNNVTEVADELIARFSLKGCLVVPTVVDSNLLITKVVASQGADFAEDIIKSHSTIGIAWGTTCYEFMLAFTNKNKHDDISVVPLIGGTSRISSEYQLNEMVRMFAEKLKGTPSFIYAPAIAESIEDKELYMQSKYMQQIVERSNQLDLAVISAGVPSSLQQQMESNIAELKKEYENDETKAVGDIAARRYNLKGEFLKNDYNAKVMGIDEENIRAVQSVICIAAGNQKVLPILGALRTKVIDYFVTDEATARKVLALL